MIVANSYNFVVPFAPQYSFDLNGANARFLSGNDVLDITGAFSISVWIKTTSTNNYNSIICKDTTGGSARAWNMTYRGTTSGLRKIQMYVWNTDGTQNTLLSSTVGALDDGNWHHVAFTYDGTAGANGMKLYVDGALDNQGTAGSTGTRNYTGSDTALGVGSTSSTSAGGFWFDGQSFQLAVWDGVILSGTDVSDIYNVGVPIDLTPYSPDIYLMDSSVFSTNWTWTDEGSAGAIFTSTNVLEAERLTDTP